jgi:epoxyqueuosine reductase
MAISPDDIKSLAYDSGFDLCGITTPEVIPDAISSLRLWLDNGLHGEMDWMDASFARRANPRVVMPEAKSIIMLGLNYYQPNNTRPSSDHGRISRYARGRDYHKIIASLQKQFIERVQSSKIEDSVTHSFLSYVDHGPILERPYGAKAGLGYIGKNAMLINKRFGSWFFLSAIVTTLDLTPDVPDAVNHGRCGECRRCIEACPTGAIVADGIIDSRLCISYLTIERPSSIDESVATRMGDMMFGCDICQEVCPHNGRAVQTTHSELLGKAGVGEFINAKEILAMESREHFLAKTAGTPLTRPRLEGLKRNAAIVLANNHLQST